MPQAWPSCASARVELEPHLTAFLAKAAAARACVGECAKPSARSPLVHTRKLVAACADCWERVAFPAACRKPTLRLRSPPIPKTTYCGIWVPERERAVRPDFSGQTNTPSSSAMMVVRHPPTGVCAASGNTEALSRFAALSESQILVTLANCLPLCRKSVGLPVSRAGELDAQRQFRWLGGRLGVYGHPEAQRKQLSYTELQSLERIAR